jgi:hypothetical protein
MPITRPSRDTLQALIDQGHSDIEIAKIYSVSRQSVHVWRKATNVARLIVAKPVKHRPTVLERFIANISIQDTPTACWIWTGSKTPLGYGKLSVNRRNTYAHRLAWEYLRGPIPDGLVIDHLCRNPSCVNPAHLEPVTQQVNTQRKVMPVKPDAPPKTHCIHGHNLSGSNLYIAPSGVQSCRECRSRNRLNYKKRKELQISPRTPLR